MGMNWLQSCPRLFVFVFVFKPPIAPVVLLLYSSDQLQMLLLYIRTLVALIGTGVQILPW